MPQCLILASASESRRKLLVDAGLSVAVRPVRIDEAAIRASLAADGAAPRDIADALAEFKARKASAEETRGPILASDQILALNGETIAKSASRDEAAQTLSRLRGQTHHLYAAAVLYEDGAPVWRHVGVARMTMHDISDAEISAYLDAAWPGVQGSVGAYHAEALGARLFARIEGDWFSVLGLPLIELCSHLRLHGWSLA